jgi:type IV pilus assembly protein PilA
MLQRLRHRAGRQEGFTLIELLVVILIIGILAAIAIPTFLNQTGKANDANAKGIARSAQTAEETWYTDHQAFTGSTTDLVNIEPTLSVPACTTSGKICGLTADNTTITGGYAVSDTTSTGINYKIARDASGTVTRTCTVPANTNAGGCALPSGQTAGAGTW